MGTRPVMPYSGASHRLSGKCPQVGHGGPFGGEEFIFLFPHDAGRSLWRAGGLRRTCEENAVPHLDGTIRFTASFGVASFEPGGDELPEAMLDTLIRHADEALYVSGKGRNRVSTYRMLTKSDWLGREWVEEPRPWRGSLNSRVKGYISQ